LQMPIFITLFFMMQRPYLYISRLGDVYYRIATYVTAIDGYTTPIQNIAALGRDKIPTDMILDLRIPTELSRLFSVYDTYDWALYLQELSAFTDAAYINTISALIDQKNMMESFLGIDLVAASGLAWPAILIPILAASSTFLASYFMSKQNAMGDGPAAKMQKQIILYVMPAMMGLITITAPAGVGLYWATSNVFQFGQQVVLNKYFIKQDAKKEEETKDTKKKK